MKDFIFLNSLPRAGNTLLGSIINSNKNVKMTANSVLPEILFKLENIKKSSIYLNFPDKKSFDNVQNSIFINYYKDWKCDCIIERGPWGTPDNLNILKNIFDNPKFILLKRPLLECICSVVLLHKIKKEETYFFVENMLMNKQGMIGQWLWGIENIVKQNLKYKIFYYKDLVCKTDKFLKELSSFINTPVKLPKKLKQFTVNNVIYNDEILANKNFHKIKTTKLVYKKYDVKNILNSKLIKKYKNEEIYF